MLSMPSVAKQKPELSSVQLDFEAIGTVWNIEFAGKPQEAATVARRVADRISEFDRTYSRFRADSWVSKIRKPGSYHVPRDFEPMFELYQKLYKITDGLVTPLIGDVMERAGYNAEYSLQPKKLRPIPKFEKCLQLHNNTLHVKFECLLDFGAAGKGYLVDLISDLLRKQGITEFVVDAGGDIREASPALRSSTPVGLEDPGRPGESIGYVELHNQSLCASAGNRRQWGEFHHIIDPSTLRSTSDIKATWVVANTTMLADGLSTALFFTSPERLAKEFDFEYVIQMADNTIRSSDNFPGRILAV